MKIYKYEVDGVLKNTATRDIFCNEIKVGQFQRVYSNVLKKIIDASLDYKYFVRIDAQVDGYPIASCKKVQRKGKIYFNAMEEGKPFYRIAYVGWKELVPDLAISNKEQMMMLHMNREGWSTFTFENNEVARWRADYNEESEQFSVELQIEGDCPFDNPALLISISHAILFIGS
ncbi:tubby C-terminal domain-like protein [Kurthia sibirica]|uniref:Tubby C-terminal domain-containing protein n=1 Tax=Kurthia sibirica TaxID=202750 RepID=A0A2U3ANC0_9BACL|nr:hypothetical protein [Kurthia sibirica]PWI26027.1 hypothetical protein DEX24_05725 [Kurthia sibirica]GEK34572.1 hypothetical protein KSI01_21050 [Kurthia sibirica]